MNNVISIGESVEPVLECDCGSQAWMIVLENYSEVENEIIRIECAVEGCKTKYLLKVAVDFLGLKAGLQ